MLNSRTPNEIWRDRNAAGYLDRTPYSIQLSLWLFGAVVLGVVLFLAYGGAI